MEERVQIASKFKYLSIAFIAIGIITLGFGFYTQPQRTWANYLLNNFYFLSLAIGASFFYAIQYISQSGWSAAFKRVPEAMFSYIPYAAALFILLYFGMHSLYHWTHPEAVATDELLAHKAPYLNIPFFYVRLLIYFTLWFLLTWVLRRLSLREDQIGGLENFKKSEFYSKVYIFVLAITFSLAVIDWIKSIDAHWFSTIFALKNFIAAFLHGVAVMILIILILHSNKLFSFLNGSHLHDFTRYIFILAIFYGYFWFSQFMLIWFANIPEETVYYHVRLEPQWRPWWIADIVLNWMVPFFILLPPILSRSKVLLICITSLLIIGHWIDLYVEIMPGVTEKAHFGLIEIGTFVGFIGFFALIVSRALSKAPIIAQKHPYLEESIYHHF
jgi:hypothetical protein